MALSMHVVPRYIHSNLVPRHYHLGYLNYTHFNEGKEESPFLLRKEERKKERTKNM
jgi:hypothetical protein